MAIRLIARETIADTESSACYSFEMHDISQFLTGDYYSNTTV